MINLAKKESQNITPEKIDLDIVYEDKDIIVINKSPNMVVHPTKRYKVEPLLMDCYIILKKVIKIV